MTIKKIHHINFLVKDLSVGVEKYQSLLGIQEFIIDDLPGRGVKTARAKVGDQWIVLVQPVDMTGIPGKHLQEHGEGFFLISYEVDNLEAAAQQAKASGCIMTSDEPRSGLENWKIWDIDSKDTFDVQIQFCVEGES